MMCERPPHPRRFGTGPFFSWRGHPPREEGNLPLLRLYVQSLQEGNTLSWQFIHTFIDRRYRILTSQARSSQSGSTNQPIVDKENSNAPTDRNYSSRVVCFCGDRLWSIP